MKLRPSLLQPIFSPRIWGARSLAPIYPDKKDLAEPIGEAWLTGRSCTFANGPFRGQTLDVAWRAMPAEWRGTRLRETHEFPLLVKFIFPDDQLSIQVHPDDAYARKHEAAAGGSGKTEMWYAVTAQRGAQVLLGFNPGVNAENFRRALADGTVDETLARVPVFQGDIFFVPAGTPHTIGPKMVLCEVQQYSDLTYRVFDYNRVDAAGRPRELHVDKALEVMRFSGQAGGKLKPVRAKYAGANVTYLVGCRYFATEKWEFSKELNYKTDHEHFDLLIFLEGAGNILWQDGSAAYQAPEVWLIPAALDSCELVPASATQLLRSYVPDLKKMAQIMEANGLGEQERSQVLFP